MEEAVSSAPIVEVRISSRRDIKARLRDLALPVADWCVALLSALLLILSFPDFELWPLAAVGLVPLLLVIAKRPKPWRSFLLGWLTGTVFFYGSCYWLTYSMINYGGIPTVLAFLFLIPVTLVVGLFPGAFALVLARAIRRWGPPALLSAALLWPALEWARLGITGQLWNALGYSQAYHPSLIQSGRWGGVYAVSFFLVAINAGIAFLLLRRTVKAAMVALAIVIVIAFVTFSSNLYPMLNGVPANTGAVVIALQPNVPMDLVKSTEQMNELRDRHVNMTEAALKAIPDQSLRRLVVWPESPMNFAYGSDAQLREMLREFAVKNKTAILFNSQEPAPNDGIYNSALFVNERGQLIAQYDKIRLLPFGEYVPVPRWMPGANLITAIVGDFTPGTSYTLMPVGETRAGVFICVESAYPFITRSLTQQGADVLINISNDGYLGRTAVMRQHLANAVFRAVENDRPVLRVTNTGITAHISERGEISDATEGFQTAVRTWNIGGRATGDTFYSRYGDVFAAICAVFSLGLLISTLRFRTKKS